MTERGLLPRLQPLMTKERIIQLRAAINAGKKARRMDLKDKAARAEFLDLARNADMVIEGFRPGVMERLGIGYETLKNVNAGIILCSISGYGADVALPAEFVKTAS